MTSYAQIKTLVAEKKPDVYHFRGFPAGVCIEQERFNGRVYLSSFQTYRIILFFQ